MEILKIKPYSYVNLGNVFSDKKEKKVKPYITTAFLHLKHHKGYIVFWIV